MQTDDIFYGVGRAADDFPVSENLPGFIYRHVILSEMNTVGSCPFHQFHMVIEDEFRSVLTAQRKRLFSIDKNLFRGSVFHAKLDPFASSFQSHAYPLYISDSRGEV